MVGWHHQLNGHEFDQAPGDGQGQGSLVCCSPWGHKESDTTEQLNNNNNKYVYICKFPEKGKDVQQIYTGCYLWNRDWDQSGE